MNFYQIILDRIKADKQVFAGSLYAEMSKLGCNTYSFSKVIDTLNQRGEISQYGNTIYLS